jgi:hypothetical protein
VRAPVMLTPAAAAVGVDVPLPLLLLHTRTHNSRGVRNPQAQASSATLSCRAATVNGRCLHRLIITSIYRAVQAMRIHKEGF